MNNSNVATMIQANMMPNGVMTLGYENVDPNWDQSLVPKEIPHTFSREFLREYRSWHNSPGERGFFISGPTGSGKTTSVEQFNARLKVPTLKVSCHPTMDVLDLKGTFVPKSVNGAVDMQFLLGPLALAFKYGYTVILDEVNCLDPGVAVSLNEIVRGQVLLVEQTGELIPRHAMFRIVSTGNDWGRGEGEQRYAGISQQNAAFLNRMWNFYMGYPKPNIEVDILLQKCAGLPVDIAKGFVKVAELLRPQISGVGEDQEKAVLDFDFSTRTLIDWGDTMVRFAKAEQPVKYALDICLGRTLCSEHKEVLNRAVEDVFSL